MAARPKPYEFRRRGRNQIQHAVSPSPGLEFGSDTPGAIKHDGRPPDDALVVQPAQSSVEQVLQSAVTESVLLTTSVEHVATRQIDGASRSEDQIDAGPVSSNQ